MMQKLIGCVILCFCLVAGSLAQSAKVVNKKALSCFQQARDAVREKKADQALELLEKAQVYDPEFSAVYLLQADIYSQQNAKANEIQAIEKAIALDSLKGHTYYFFVLAENYFDQGDYAEAQNFYVLYLRKDPRQDAREQAGRQLRNCEFALAAMKSQVRQPVEIYLQGELPVYWPSLDVTGRTLLFTEQDEDRERMWMLRDSVRRPLNFKTVGNFGAPSLTADGQTMYFSMDGGRDGFDIYVSYRLSEMEWSEPISLGYPVNTSGWEAQPAISADGTKLYFASARDGGRGGSDIWFSRLLRREANGRQIWSQPRCLYFNTAKDEMAPFLYFDNKTLFFASDGYPGMGRKDIYKADVNRVSTPLNIGITVNTRKEEFGFIVDASGQWGYFSSDVSGKRCIYRYRLEDGVACPPAAYVRLQVEDRRGHLLTPDRLTVTEVASADTLACYDGVYAHTQMLACVPVRSLLLVSVVKKGYLYYSDTLRVHEATLEQPMVCKVVLREIQPDQSLILKGMFFDVDDYRLKPESYHELQQLLEFLRLNPDVKIEISGHTDSTGEAGHNRQLSEDRAFEVYKYLFLKRIPKERMSYKGYGADVPLAPNDTEEGKARNRRTEIRIK